MEYIKNAYDEYRKRSLYTSQENNADEIAKWYVDFFLCLTEKINNKMTITSIFDLLTFLLHDGDICHFSNHVKLQQSIISSKKNYDITSKFSKLFYVSDFTIKKRKCPTKVLQKILSTLNEKYDNMKRKNAIYEKYSTESLDQTDKTISEKRRITLNKILMEIREVINDDNIVNKHSLMCTLENEHTLINDSLGPIKQDKFDTISHNYGVLVHALETEIQNQLIEINESSKYEENATRLNTYTPMETEIYEKNGKSD